MRQDVRSVRANCAMIVEVGKALGIDSDVCKNYLLFDQIEAIFDANHISLPKALNAANSYFNSSGFPKHLAAVGTFLLQKLGEGDDQVVKSTAQTLISKTKPNAFFTYLADNTPGHSLARALTLSQCPTTKPGPRSVWLWEQADIGPKETADSMYSDCIFMGNLLSKP
jgi:hypothetical protein